MATKFYIIAGEASGDLHASNLIKQLKIQVPNAEFRCWGGDLMEQQGAKIVKHYKELAFMGFVEVLLNIRTILKNMRFCKEDIQNFEPDAIIFVDYPGFNLKIAKWAKENNFNTIYYISPQIWAWKQNRVHQIKKNIDKMFVILPFEKKFYEKFDVTVDFVGHPLLDAIEDRSPSNFEDFCKENNLTSKPIIALLPGSRKQEIKTMLPVMLEATKDFNEFQIVIAGAPSQSQEFYLPFLNDNVSLLSNKTYSLLEHSSLALVTSGTATLETALFNVPQIVCYKGSKISYQIAKAVIKVNYISLVNLIMDKDVVKELIQGEFNAKNIQKEIQLLLTPKKQNEIKAEYKELKIKLGGNGASKNTATLISEYLKTRC